MNSVWTNASGWCNRCNFVRLRYVDDRRTPYHVVLTIRIAPAASSGGLFGLPPKPADPQGTTAAPAATGTSGTAAATGSTPAVPGAGLFGGGGLFGAKAPSATPAAGTTGSSTATPAFGLGGNKDASKDAASTTGTACVCSSLIHCYSIELLTRVCSCPLFVRQQARRKEGREEGWRGR